MLKRSAALLAVMICLFASQGCAADIDAPWLASLLGDFVFVGSAPYKLDTSQRDHGPSMHSNQRQALPRTLKMGIAYIFHHRSPVNNLAMALEVFPERLSRIGAESVEAPKTPRDLTYVYVGGPLFAIKFRINGRPMLLKNGLDGDLVKTAGDQGIWALEDFVLVVLPE